MKRIRKFTILALFLAFVAVSSVAIAQDKPQLPPGMTPEIMKMMMTPGAPHPPGLPQNLVPVGGCIPAMGFHYVNMKNWPTGPIYGYFNGKPIFTEVMPTKEQFETGFDMNNVLKPLPGYKIDHVDIWYEPKGHPGMEGIPHYDIHAYYVSHAEHMKYCKNPSGKKPVFL
jgi:hypothetical protein